jgi:hypothetical protein
VTRRIVPSAIVGLLAIAAWLVFTGPASAQVPVPNPTPNERGWHTEPFTVTFSHPALTCDPSQLRYEGPDTASASLTSTCTDPNDQLPAETMTYEFKYDATAPIVTITEGPAEGSVSEDRRPTFSFTASEADVTLTCLLDAVVYSACASPWQHPPSPQAPLGDGPHTFSVSAVDPAGNAGVATRNWTVAVRPTNVALPVIVGAAGEAETLSTDGGRWLGGTPPVQTLIQWQRCDGGGCTNIAGASQTEYVVQPTDVGRRIRVQVLARNIAGDVVVYSALTDVVVPLDRTLPQTTIIRQPPNPTNKRAAFFTFDATRADATFQCKLDAGVFAPCGSPREYLGLAAGTHTFEVRAAFTAKNGERLVEDTPAAAIWVIDLRPPPAPGFVRLRPGDRRIRLSWLVPRVADISGTRVARVRVRRPGALVRFLTGSRLTDTGLRNGTRYRYALRTIDKAGNRSLVKVVHGRPRDSLLAPREGALVSRPPLLRWRARPHATYYNLQLYKIRPGLDRKMLSTWPVRASYQLRQRWFYGGRRVLRPGKYRWYVWPGFGSFAENRYGPLMGTSVFTKR